MKVYKTDRTTENLIDENCYIIEIINDPSEDLSLARARVPSNVTTKLHSLTGTTEIYYILEGEGLMTIENESSNLAKGDSVVIQPNMAQQIKNTGDQDLIILCICQPRFQFNQYKDLSTLND